MTWSQFMLVVDNVSLSSKFYCEIFGFESGHGGDQYEQLLCKGELIMQLHDNEEDNHHAALAEPNIKRGKRCFGLV